MAKMSLCTFVNAPVERVFDAYSSFDTADQVVEAIVRIEMLTDGPVRLGTRFKETRVMFGRECTEEMEVTQFDRNRSITVSADSCGSHFDSTFCFTPERGGTRVDMDVTTKAQTLFAKLMSPICVFMTSSMKKMMLADMEQVKAACEGSSGAAVPAR